MFFSIVNLAISLKNTALIRLYFRIKLSEKFMFGSDKYEYSADDTQEERLVWWTYSIVLYFHESEYSAEIQQQQNDCVRRNA